MIISNNYLKICLVTPTALPNFVLIKGQVINNTGVLFILFNPFSSEIMTHTIVFKDISSSLGTRDLGAKVRTSIIEKVEKNEKVYLDFEGVDVVTNSFANECFGKLREILSSDIFRNKIAFLNTNDFVQRSIISAL